MPLSPSADPTTPLFTREGASLARDGVGTEWLLTNGLGGFSMGTVLGVPTRRYHGLLVAATAPPVGRVNALTAVDEKVVIAPGAAEETAVHLSLFHFADAPDRPSVHPHLHRFERGFFGCRWVFRVPFQNEEVEVEKLLHLFDRRNAVNLTYTVRSSGLPVRLEVRPLARLDDFHKLLVQERLSGGERIVPGESPFRHRAIENGFVIAGQQAGLHVHSNDAPFLEDPQWWRGFHYEWERDRGQDHVEDLFSPGLFAWTTVPSAGSTELEIFASTDAEPPSGVEEDAGARDRRVGLLTRSAIKRAGGEGLEESQRAVIAALVRASDHFVVERIANALPARDDEDPHAAHPGVSIIAGYPWFADWGRDTMIALPGLLLCSERFGESRRVLETFAAHRRNGIIPNRFDDNAGEAHYNTVDASLWFLHAVSEHARWAGEEEIYDGEVGKACRDVVRAYAEGTDYGIAMDPDDGLIAAGSDTTQLTWMDAQRDGRTFTPRHGKAVEINALWHHGLVRTGEAFAERDPDFAERCRTLARDVRESFTRVFWNESSNCLFDTLTPVRERTRGHPVWRPSGDIRPNQIFAVSLEHSPLEQKRHAAVVDVVRRRLLTRHGLRTLDPADPAYKGRFEGPLYQRDEAYHNGTAWPWLIGPYAEAVMRVGGVSEASRAEAREALSHLIERLDGECLGQIWEVFDGDDTPDFPQRARGCIAQAWSVAETLRTYVMTLTGRG